MNAAERSTVHVQGLAHVRQRPSILVMLGRTQASAPTLQLALEQLQRKAAAVSRLLQELQAENLQFGEPRFPDQVTLDPIRITQRATRRRLKGCLPEPPPSDAGKRRVLLAYSAQWPIADKSPEELLVFLDAIQFETTKLREEEPQEEPSPTPDWQNAAIQALNSVMAANAEEPPAGEETYFLFVSRMGEAERQQAANEAFRDAQTRAARLAQAAGRTLGELKSINWYPGERDATRAGRDYQRSTFQPLVSEAPFQAGPGESIDESPSAAALSMTLNVTYELQ